MIGTLLIILFTKIGRFAYIEFAEKESVEKALKLDDSHFKGRQLKVNNNVETYLNERLKYYCDFSLGIAEKTKRSCNSG